MDITSWRHAFKLDPAKTITNEELELLAESGTDGIIVGGTDEVTLDNVLDLLVRIRRYLVPLALEVSTVESVTPGFDYYFIPTVLNSTKTEWINGIHHKALREYGHMMDWDEIITEGYCILNPDCKAAQLTGVTKAPDEEDVIAYARMTEHLFKTARLLYGIQRHVRRSGNRPGGSANSCKHKVILRRRHSKCT